MIATKQGKVDEFVFARLLEDAKAVPYGRARGLWHEHGGDAVAALESVIRQCPERKQELGRLWGDTIGHAYIDTRTTLVSPELVQKLPTQYAERHKILPLYSFGGAVTVATPHPERAELRKELENYFDQFVSLVFSFPSEIQSSLQLAYLSESYLSQLLENRKLPALENPEDKLSASELVRLAGDKAIVNFTEGLVFLALKENASDIHVEPGQDGGRIRFRIDGVLQDKFQLENNLLPPLTTRLKVMAEMDISEHRRPQDGHTSLKLAGRTVDMRLSSVPTMHGEKMVLRVLAQTQLEALPDLENLGFSPGFLDDLHRMIRNPNGIIFVTGPTGSGKTTTLYAVLKALNHTGLNIMTVEDPVEFQFKGINQVQVNAAIGVDFVTMLRAFLRQDPDIILVGEIRDIETARIACQAALTGHLVLTTLHTNDSLQAVIRLMDMGIEPYIVLPSIIGVTAQRLVRRLCPQCKQARYLRSDEMERFFEYDGTPELTVWEPVGCKHCRNTGFSGRLPIQESFVVDDEVRVEMSRRPSLRRLRKIAEERHFHPVRHDGLKKLVRGLTSLGELERVIAMD